MSASRLSSERHRAPRAAWSTRLAALILVLAGWLSAADHAWAAPVALLLLSDPGETYQEVARAFRAGLGERLPVRVANLDGLRPEGLRPARGEELLLVPVGLAAARFVAENLPAGAAVLALMVPRQGFEALPWPPAGGRRRVSAVFIDQPPERSLLLIALLSPRPDRVGLVLSEGVGEELRDLRQAAQRLGLSLSTQTVESGRGVADALRRLLPHVDALLLLPDGLVVNAANVQNVLLASYRHRVPVVGFSPGLVGAGAVAAVYSAPERIGRRGAELALPWAGRAGGEDLPPPGPAPDFALAFNPKVARALGLAVPEEGEARARLAAGGAERRP